MKTLLLALVLTLLCGLLIGVALTLGRNAQHKIVLMEERDGRERIYLWDVTRDVRLALSATCSNPLTSNYFGQGQTSARPVTPTELPSLLHCPL